jgi:hypothetical protein
MREGEQGMTKSNQGFGDNQSDRERAEIRGKGRAPDYEPGSDEGTRQFQEPGQRGDTTSLRGHETGRQDTPRNDRLKADNPPESGPQPQGGRG